MSFDRRSPDGRYRGNQRGQNAITTAFDAIQNYVGGLDDQIDRLRKDLRASTEQRNSLQIAADTAQRSLREEQLKTAQLQEDLRKSKDIYGDVKDRYEAQLKKATEGHEKWRKEEKAGSEAKLKSCEAYWKAKIAPWAEKVDGLKKMNEGLLKKHLEEKEEWEKEKKEIEAEYGMTIAQLRGDLHYSKINTLLDQTRGTKQPSPKLSVELSALPTVIPRSPGLFVTDMERDMRIGTPSNLETPVYGPSGRSLSNTPIRKRKLDVISGSISPPSSKAAWEKRIRIFGGAEEQSSTQLALRDRVTFKVETSPSEVHEESITTASSEARIPIDTDSQLTKREAFKQQLDRESTTISDLNLRFVIQREKHISPHDAVSRADFSGFFAAPDVLASSIEQALRGTSFVLRLKIPNGPNGCKQPPQCLYSRRWGNDSTWQDGEGYACDVCISQRRYCFVELCSDWCERFIVVLPVAKRHRDRRVSVHHPVYYRVWDEKKMGPFRWP